MKVVVVESPAKAKTINKYLGRDYEVLASFGHVRDLPPKDGSVDPDQDFVMKWELEAKGAKHVAEIARTVKGSDGLILATDPDREGEAISWHIVEALNAKRVLKGVPVERVTFNAITRDAVTKAMAHPRAIDQALVDAYLARRALDYLVGFNLSPVLWRKLPGARSAGRVQSVALRLVCDRELEIERFVAREYWSILASLKTPAGAAFEARLVGADGQKITRLDVGTATEAEAFKQALDAASFRVASIEAKPGKRHPFPPFTTSTLQQEASRKLGMSPAVTMRIAQRLYEGVNVGGETVGLITYMRTDGVDMAPEAIADIRRAIESDHGKRYLPHAPRQYTNKAKNAQEAHEAIRPTDPARHPKQMARLLESDQARLYELIWVRAVASQMESAILERTTAEITAKAGTRTLDLRATGQVVNFDGFLKLYQEGRDEEPEDEENRRLPPMSAGDPLGREKIDIAQHFTEPPPRYSEASLIKRMEELGIGRPSTYASILAVLKERDYVTLEKKRLVAADKGRIVTAFLENFFKRYVEYDFTASLEEDLDRISNSEIEWKEVMRRFWEDFSTAIAGTKELRTAQVLDALNDALGPHIFPDKGDGSNPRACPSCGNGTISLKLGKFGVFIGCSNYPECRFTRQLSAASGANGNGEASGVSNGTQLLGKDEASGSDVTLRDGRFGPYLQLGEGEKPKRVSIPKGLAPAAVDLAKALQLLSLPREVARHPESGEPILAGIGRYGPYVQHGKTFANLERTDDVLEIGANRAIDLIVARETAGPGRGRFGGGGTPPGRPLGDHPDGGAVTVRPGRFGPYVNHGKLNATLPKGLDQETITLDQALALLQAKEAAGGGKTARRGASSRKASSSKAGAKSVPKGKAGAKAKAGPKAKAVSKAKAGPKTASKSKSKAAE
ncbi:DNA topoisomerase I [Rhizobiales bacterium GAS191]|nr:DNA topoisomerase I [Rhizobiales bacterium GAS113]SEE21832.1 DNA topoisomerase I [Rhizobiales bacterium GAS191]